MQLFDELHQAGNTVVLVTHEPDIAEHAWRKVMLRDGKVTSDQATARAVAAGGPARAALLKGSSPWSSWKTSASPSGRSAPT